MKILILTRNFFPKVGGIENHIYSLVKSVESITDYTYEIAELDLDYKEYKKEEYDGIPVHRLPAFGKKPFVFSNLNKYLSLSQFDCVHVHDPHLAGITFSLLFSRYQGRKINSSHGFFFHTQKQKLFKKIYFYTITRWLLKMYDILTCVSKSDYKRVENIIPKSKLVLIENGIDLAKFQNVNNINKDNLTFLYYGRLWANKNIDTLINVFNEVDNKYKLIIVGNAKTIEYENYLKDLAKNNEKIFFYDKMSDDDLIKTMTEATFFITSSKYEGFGMTVIESMAAGLIPVVNNISPIKDFVEDNKGFIVDFSKGHDAATKINDLLDNIDQTTLRVMRERAKLFSEQFDWKFKALEYKKIYKD